MDWNKARDEAATWLRRSVLYYPQLDLRIPGNVVGAQQKIDAGLVSRIKTAYQLASGHFEGTGDSVWTAISARSSDIHDALFAQDDERITQILEDPIRTSLFDGYYSVERDLKLDEHSPETMELRRWAVHQVAECLVRLAQATGATPLWNPERTKPERDGGQSITATGLEELLLGLDREIGVRIEFPNPIEREFGLPTARGIASYRAPHAIYQAWRIRQLLRETEGARVLEIGAGMGRTAYYASRLGITDLTIVDLPLANVAQANFLGRVLGPESIWVPGDTVADQQGRIRICPPDWLANSDTEFDVVLNVDSITEMDVQHATSYVHKISRCATAFLSINHEANLFSARALLSRCGADVRTLRYPYWLRKGYLEEISFF